MRRIRLPLTLLTAVALVLVNAPAALAKADGGQGWWGESTDPVVTNTMFIVIAFFPVLITIFSLLQWWLDKRKHAREDAVRAREMSADWRGGW